MEIKFIKYTSTPGEKHLGIAEIDLGGIIVLRYRVMPGKDGKGFFVATAAYKIGEDYISSFSIDSRSMHDKIVELIRHGMKNPSKQDEEYGDMPF